MKQTWGKRAEKKDENTGNDYIQLRILARMFSGSDSDPQYVFLSLSWRTKRRTMLRRITITKCHTAALHYTPR